MKINCITFSVVFKMEIGNSNSGYNQDIISTLKKIELPNGDSYPYISGQSIRRMVRERMKDFGFPFSPKSLESGQGKSPFVTACDPVKYPDDDLFGFMDPKPKLSRTRTSPVRVSPAIAMFPYNYDRDLGIQNNSDINRDHRMYETEVTSNLYTYSVLIEVDRIGKGESEIINEGKLSNWEIELEERIKRIKGVLGAFLYLWGGGKQSRLLTNQKPIALAISMQSVKNPLWMGKISIDETKRLNDESLEKIIKENSEIIDYAGIGVEDDLIKSIKFKKTPKEIMNEVIDRVGGIF